MKVIEQRRLDQWPLHAARLGYYSIQIMWLDFMSHCFCNLFFTLKCLLFPKKLPNNVWVPSLRVSCTKMLAGHFSPPFHEWHTKEPVGPPLLAIRALLACTCNHWLRALNAHKGVCVVWVTNWYRVAKKAFGWSSEWEYGPFKGSIGQFTGSSYLTLQYLQCIHSRIQCICNVHQLFKWVVLFQSFAQGYGSGRSNTTVDKAAVGNVYMNLSGWPKLWI